jgi:glycerophosphoryl diester phosphodiesterase
VMASLNFNPPVIAHRGASAYAPENTLIAFAKAAQLGVKWIEFDVMQAACGEPIIFHDETLERTTNGVGDVNIFPYSYLQTLDAGSYFQSQFARERIPSLRLVLEFLQNTNLSANIELKGLPGQEKKLIKRVLKELESYSSLYSRILFSSFSIPAIELLREYAPYFAIGLLLHEWEPKWDVLCNRLQCDSVHVNQEIMTPLAAKKIKAMKRVLLCYTVNDPARALELFSWGVDAVFSDVPDIIMQALPLK